MDAAALTIPAARLSRFEEPWDRPLAIIDIDQEPDFCRDLVLPPCPVLGIGRRDHPLAAMLDAVIEPPFDLQTIVGQIVAQSDAAATLVQVLRTTALLPVPAALTVESMAYAMLQGSAGHAAWKAAQTTHPVLPEGRVAVVRQGNLLEIAFDRAEAGNAIDRPMRDALTGALRLAAIDPEITRVRLVGRGKAFSLGADLAEFGTTADPARAHAIRGLTLPAHAAYACAERLEAHVDGACIGAGLELAGFAARVTATSRSWFQLPELAMGIIPGAGGCVSLPRRIGRQRTALLVLSGRRIGARQALDWGLVDALVDDPSGDQGGDDVARAEPQPRL